MHLIRILPFVGVLLTLSSCAMVGGMYNRHPVFGLVLLVVLALAIVGIYYVLQKAQQKEDNLDS